MIKHVRSLTRIMGRLGLKSCHYIYPSFDPIAGAYFDRVVEGWGLKESKDFVDKLTIWGKVEDDI